MVKPLQPAAPKEIMKKRISFFRRSSFQLPQNEFMTIKGETLH